MHIPFRRYQKKTLFVVDISITWATNRNWQAKVLDTWKVTQLNLPHQDSANRCSQCPKIICFWLLSSPSNQPVYPRDEFTCCQTETGVADWSCYLIQSGYTNTKPITESVLALIPSCIGQGSHTNTNSSITWIWTLCFPHLRQTPELLCHCSSQISKRVSPDRFKQNSTLQLPWPHLTGSDSAELLHVTTLLRWKQYSRIVSCWTASDRQK